jgi:hypothetical protein
MKLALLIMYHSVYAAPTNSSVRVYPRPRPGVDYVEQKRCLLWGLVPANINDSLLGQLAVTTLYLQIVAET